MKLSDGQPCTNFQEYNSRSTKQLSQLEQSMGSGCSYDPQTNTTYDTRYTQLKDYTVTEYDLFSYNGVISILENLPGYGSQYNSDKKNAYY